MPGTDQDHQRAAAPASTGKQAEIQEGAGEDTACDAALSSAAPKPEAAAPLLPAGAPLQGRIARLATLGQRHSAAAD